MSEVHAPAVVGQFQASVKGTLPQGSYVRVGIHAPAIAQNARPGQFVALAVGDAPTATLLRRCFSIAEVSAERGDFALLISPVGAGSRWLTQRSPGDEVNVVGPLGQPFPMPASDAGCVLIGGGYGAAPMVWWARELLAAGHQVALILGAGDAGRLAEVEAAAALGVSVFVTTDDGSVGTKGRVTDVLAEAIASVGGAEGRIAAEVYACGPMAMLSAVTSVADEHGARTWCAVEEAMACGVGICMTCVLPIRGEDGVTRMVRSCTDGPTFDGACVRWDAITTHGDHAGARVPADAWGAPK